MESSLSLTLYKNRRQDASKMCVCVVILDFAHKYVLASASALAIVMFLPV